MSITFYRDQLESEQARGFYDSICQSITDGNIGGIFPLTYSGRDSAARDSIDAIHALRRDRPDFFFISGASKAIMHNGRFTLMNKVLYTPEQISRIKIHLDKMLTTFAADTAGMSEWEKEKTVYARLVRYLTYVDHSTEKGNPKDYDHNIVGPLLQGSGVCEGFSCLLMLALRRVGIPCIRISGFGRTEAHCWNMAWINGTPVHLDITWDGVNTHGDVGYFYFNLTDEQIMLDHKITTKGLPSCTNPMLGYQFREGTVFSSASEAAQFFKKAFANGAGPYSVRFSDDGDVRSIIKEAMRNAPVLRYKW